MKEKWIDSHVAMVRRLQSPSDHQKLLLLLLDKPEKSSEDTRKINALLRAEEAAEHARKLKIQTTRLVNAEKTKKREARNHEMFRAAGLMSLAGLLDTETGLPKIDRGELLGALMGLAAVPSDDPKRAKWKAVGDAKLAESTK